jgi:hypothetical protein
MISRPLHRFIRRPFLAILAFARDPAEAWIALQDRNAERAEQDIPTDLYRADAHWESEMHRLLGLSMPCQMTSEFWSLWPDVMAELVAKGIRPGPESFKGWNDGDAALVRAIWCLVRHLGAQRVVETGVAHGVTSRFILEALARNGGGHLWSIDHPPLEPEWHKQIATAVDGRFPDRWTYIRGSSRRRLPSLLSQLGEIDLFVHDSLHSEHNVRFEVERAWAALRPGGAIVVDDIDANRGFQSFTESFSGHRSIVCEAEPVRSDKRRFNDKGLFGIVVKAPTASALKH